MRQTLDPLVFGHRLRHFRRQRNLTLDQLGDLVGKPAPYLSMVETGKREPKLSLIGDLADALGIGALDLLSHEAPSNRAHLEVTIARAQEEELYAELALPHLKPTAKTPDLALEHIVGLYEALRRRTVAESITHDVARDVTAELRREAKERGNHDPAIEALAADALAAIDYAGTGPLSQRNVLDLAQAFGYTVHTVPDFPPTARAIADRSNGRLYIPQRNELRTRAARSVILQAIGHAAMGHTEPVDFVDFLRQRLEANYFAGAVLIPEAPAVEFLLAAKERRDLSVGDLKELFYASYEMAAHRFTNLATEHLSIPVHFLRTVFFESKAVIECLTHRLDGEVDVTIALQIGLPINSHNRETKLIWIHFNQRRDVIGLVSFFVPQYLIIDLVHMLREILEIGNY